MVVRVKGLVLLGATAVFAAGSSAMEPSDHLQTAGGTPVVHMWDCPMPDPTRPAAGFAVVEGAQHAEIYHATRETGERARRRVGVGRARALGINAFEGFADLGR